MFVHVYVCMYLYEYLCINVSLRLKLVYICWCNLQGLRQLESYATATAENKIGGRNMGLLHKGNDHGVPGQAEGKWVSNMDYKPSVGHYFSEEIDNDAGFVAFSADYHTPRHHPPKNN